MKKQPFIVDVYEIHDDPGVTITVGACDVLMTVQQARSLAVDILSKIKLFNDANSTIDTTSIDGLCEALITAGASNVVLVTCDEGCSHMTANFTKENSGREPGRREWYA